MPFLTVIEWAWLSAYGIPVVQQHKTKTRAVSESNREFLHLYMAALPVASRREWKVQSYVVQRDTEWPQDGRNILAQYDADSVIVYQAYCPEIAEYAVENQK